MKEIRAKDQAAVKNPGGRVSADGGVEDRPGLAISRQALIRALLEPISFLPFFFF